MDKSQGVTIGTVLIAAVLAHPISGMHSAFDRAGHAGTHAPSSIPGIRAEGDGPWVASCEYWAPDRRAAKEERYEPAVVWKWINGERREFDQNQRPSAVRTREEDGASPKGSLLSNRRVRQR